MTVFEAWLSSDKIIRKHPPTGLNPNSRTEAFSISNLHKLPIRVGDGSRWFDSHVCFFGEISAFSNFHPARFIVEDTIFENTEQYLFHQTALKVGDDVTANRILDMNDP